MGSVIGGRALSKVSTMSELVRKTVLNRMLSAPARALASSMAARKVHSLARAPPGPGIKKPVLQPPLPGEASDRSLMELTV